MRRTRYAVAPSLDRYIAGPDGEADWIIKDPAIDFRAIDRQFWYDARGATNVRGRTFRIPNPENADLRIGASSVSLTTDYQWSSYQYHARGSALGPDPRAPRLAPRREALLISPNVLFEQPLMERAGELVRS